MIYTLITLAALTTATILLALYWRWRRPAWTGFAGRTLWDWISLLAVPMVVGFATVLINAVQQDLADDRAAEAAFQQYIDRVTALVLDAPEGVAPDTVNAIGRAQTMAVLRLVEGERAGRALAFLAELDLLRRFAISFEGIDLNGAELKGIDFSGVDFEGADLTGADLEGGHFENADFEECDLEGVDLKGAILRGAGFENTRLAGAELSGADLRYADLSSAAGLTSRQLAQACYDQTTTLPAGMSPPTGQSDGCFTGVIDDD